MAHNRGDTDFEKGSRVQLNGCRPGCDSSLARKMNLWQSPEDKRGGVVISMRSDFFVLILDEPLNLNPSEEEIALTAKYMAFRSRTGSRMENHVLLIRELDIKRGFVSLTVQLQRALPASDYTAYVMHEKGHLGYCMKCKKAQYNRNLLVSCTKNHTLCKACIVPWNETEDRADLQICAQFTDSVKRYCVDILGFEPPCLPTRVLLGYHYWKTEDADRSVIEFSDCDTWVCYCCRFNHKQEFTVKWRFIHDQLFPNGMGLAEATAQILNQNERDMFARFNVTMPSLNSSQAPNALRLKSDVTLNVYLPALCVRHTVRCLATWTMNDILMEILSATGTVFHEELSIYKIDPTGWEVQLVEPYGDELAADATLTEAQRRIFCTIGDLSTDDYLVLRLRKSHAVGNRSHLDILGQAEYVDNEILARSFDGFRKIGGDGHCYYRAIAFGMLEDFVLSQNLAGFRGVKNILASVMYPDGKDNADHAELLHVLEEAAQGKIWPTTEDLQAAFLLDTSIDAAIVRACRTLLSDFMIANSDFYTPSGLTLEDLYKATLDDYTNMATYCNTKIRPMEPASDAEGAFVNIGLLPSLLRLECTIFSLAAPVENPYLEINGPAWGAVDILLRPGHYDLLYKKGRTFSQPVRAAIGQTNAAHTDEAESKDGVKDSEKSPAKFANDVLVEKFLGLTHTTPEIARKWLKEYDFDVDSAVRRYYHDLDAKDGADDAFADPLSFDVLSNGARIDTDDKDISGAKFPTEAKGSWSEHAPTKDTEMRYKSAKDVSLPDSAPIDPLLGIGSANIAALPKSSGLDNLVRKIIEEKGWLHEADVHDAVYNGNAKNAQDATNFISEKRRREGEDDRYRV